MFGRSLAIICCVAWAGVGSVAAAQIQSQALAQPKPSPIAELRLKIEAGIKKSLAASGAPSVSVAVVKDGQLVFTGAYGSARLEPRLAASPEMHYCIGSISKQFTATAMLVLAEQGVLSLDDKVGRFLPNLSRGNEVTIRMLLSHTSGYRDYWPQDYVMPTMLVPTTPAGILDGWARVPLDFEPGTKWQYSNTNFTIAGLIIEKASGMPYMQFLRTRVLEPLGLKNVIDIDQGSLGPADPTGYLRYALGPPRPAPKMGSGWLFAMGQLAMTASDLARWNQAMMERRLLKPASYAALTSEVLLKSGAATHYGLGISVGLEDERRVLRHNGEISGFTASNVVFPEERAAIVVLVNQDATELAGELAAQIKPLLFDSEDANAAKAHERDRKIFIGLQHGTIERSLFTPAANSYFSAQALKDFSASLAPLGAPQEFKETEHRMRGGMVQRVYSVKLSRRSVRAWSRELSDGKIEEFLVSGGPNG